MSNELIIQQLKDKEAQLLTELNKVRLALQAFIDGNIPYQPFQYNYNTEQYEVPEKFDRKLTYNVKILFVLKNGAKPLLVEEIVQALHLLEPEIEINKLHKNVSYNLSMLAKYSRIRKHPFNRKIKYSIL